eukprot:m.1045863 g.1045863  ORF g.1045863 m.1045863 type:complete len:172 (+) comp24170_c0_seq93:2956-3471(+)
MMCTDDWLLLQVETDLSRRVQDWEDRIRPALEAESTRNDFDIHELGANVLKRFKKKDLGSKASFSQITSTCKPYEVSRLFLAALQLANNGNLEIDSSVQGPAVSANTFVVPFMMETCSQTRCCRGLEGQGLSIQSTHRTSRDVRCTLRSHCRWTLNPIPKTVRQQIKCCCS